MEILYALVVTVCLGTECDLYAIDKDFTIEDCTKARAELLKNEPHAKAECVELDLE